MKCTITTIELETLVSRINRGTVDLQPAFQRGEVWSDELNCFVNELRNKINFE